MKGSPPLQLHIPSTSKPVACHVPAPLPLHWHNKVKADIEQDVRLGVLERVLTNTPVRWLSLMVLTPKHDGTPVNPRQPPLPLANPPHPEPLEPCLVSARGSQEVRL